MEKRLIDADVLEQHCKNTKIIELFPEWKDFPYEMKIALIRYGNAWKEIIQNTPTVDAVEVVRCKDCKHCKKYRNRLDPMLNHQLCVRMDKYAFGVDEDDFCSYGERRTE